MEFQSSVFLPAGILLPKPGVDLTKWAVVACDQFTSQPEYWQAVEETVGDAPSTLRLILPEACLNAPDVSNRIEAVNAAMRRYLEEGLFQTLENAMLYVERTQSDGTTRRGLIGMVDLEQYDFTPGSGALVRATEGTVLERVPPRVQVRREAPVELPHVMLLIDDPNQTVIEPLTAEREAMEPLYAFDLQQGGGRLAGWRLTAPQIASAVSGLASLCRPEEQARKYGLKNAPPLLFAVGDGNHSLAAAKQCYEDLKKVTPPEQWSALPGRFALAEVVNCRDAALQFEPIHRVVSGIDPKALLNAFQAFYPEAFRGRGAGHCIEYICADESGVLTVPNPAARLAAGTLQAFLDQYLQDRGGDIDYIHGAEVAERLGRQRGCIGFRLPAMEKEDLFKTVMADGVLPRKTFSMGHAQDKRYYMEARKIQ